MSRSPSRPSGAARRAARRSGPPAGLGRLRRLGHVADLSAYLLGLLVIALVVNFFARRPWLRLEIDATKTRAYSLSEQTRRLLDGLEGEWTIALVMVEDQVDRALRRQIDEVLTRFTRRSPSLSVLRIDPVRPESLRDYETLLAGLRARYGDVVEQYDAALDRGVESFAGLTVFAQRKATELEQLARSLPGSFAGRQGLERRAEQMGRLAEHGAVVLDDVAAARRVDERQPIADYEAARSTLAAVLEQWAQELFDVARLLERALDDPGAGPDLRGALLVAGREYDQTSTALVGAADPLKQLPPLELSRIGRTLKQGEAAVILGPKRAAVIPSAQLFARTVHRLDGDSPVTFDQRFRGEQILASAIRSLRVASLPKVVFVHAEDRSMLRRRDDDVDLVGVASMLAASRLAVDEWRVADGERPRLVPGQPVVWIVLPPLRRRGLEPSAEETRLLDAAEHLLAEGEPVMVNLYPSHWPRYRRVDPWAALVEPFGVRAATGEPVFESRRVGEDAVEIVAAQELQRYPGDHPVAAAAQGLRANFAVPVPLAMETPMPAGVRAETLVEVPAGPNRWRERDWNRPPETITPPPAEARLAEGVAIAVALERDRTADRTGQRVVVVGSGGWMLSRVADLAVSVGGERYALYNPGNVELTLASVYWLAGMDDLIAPGPASREVARLAGLSDGVRRAWWWLSLVALPGACLALGLGMWARRRWW